MKWKFFFTIIQCTKLFELELSLCIKMDLVWITYKGWYAIKTNKQTNKKKTTPEWTLSSRLNTFVGDPTNFYHSSVISVVLTGIGGIRSWSKLDWSIDNKYETMSGKETASRLLTVAVYSYLHGHENVYANMQAHRPAMSVR